MLQSSASRPGLVVVGGSLAGLRAVEMARSKGYNGRITLIGAEKHLPYDRPPLSKAFLTANAACSYYCEERVLHEDLGVDLRLGTAATGLDSSARAIVIGAQQIRYDRAIIATGAVPRKLGHLDELPGLVTLRTLDDALEIRSAVRPGTRVVVVGAGFIGSEIASSARALGATVTILEAAPVPLVRAVGSLIGAALSNLHGKNGVQLRCGVQVEAVLGTIRVTGVRLATGETIDADLVVVGIGAAPATSWLTGSGILLNTDGGIRCDEYLQTSIPGVYAAGDVASWPNAIMDGIMRLENWTSAAEQGGRATLNALFPEAATPYETVPYYWSDWYSHRIQFVGTPVADEVVFVSGEPDGEDKFVALYRSGDRLIGAATLNEPRKIMKFRRHIATRGTWAAALEIFPAVSTASV